MSNITTSRNRKLYRLWAVPLFSGGLLFLARAADGRLLQHALFGIGMLLAGAFALRHDLLDVSPRGLDPRQIGLGWVAVLIASVSLVLAAAAIGFAA
jgi:hypothetical protein